MVATYSGGLPALWELSDENPESKALLSEGVFRVAVIFELLLYLLAICHLHFAAVRAPAPWTAYNTRSLFHVSVV